jgi:hypothetical protein
VFNLVNWGNPVSSMSLTSQTNQTVTNNQYNADGSLNEARAKPNQAGFGAINSADALRTVQVQLRFNF